MTLEELKRLANEAHVELGENDRKRRGEIAGATTIAAYLRYVAAVHELSEEIEYE